MVTKHRKVSIQKLVGIYILTTILKKKVFVTRTAVRSNIYVDLSAVYSRVPSGMARCKGHQGWYGLSRAFREGRSPLLDIYRGGPFMASKSQGTKKNKNRTIKKHLCTISRKNNISY